MTKAQTELLIAFGEFLLKTVPSRGASSESERLKLKIAAAKDELAAGFVPQPALADKPFDPALHRTEAEAQRVRDVTGPTRRDGGKRHGA